MKHLIVFLVLTTMTAFCTKQKKSNNERINESQKNISFTKIQRFGDKDKKIFDRMDLVEVDAQNRVYIAEKSIGSRKIHVFSQDGSYLTSVSREGNGPGDYRSLVHLQVISDSLYLFDYVNKRISIFNKDQWSHSYSFSRAFTLSTKTLTKVRQQGARVAHTFFFRDGQILAGFEEPPVPNKPDRKIYYYTFNLKGKPLKKKPLFIQNAINIFKSEGNRFSVTIELPFANRPILGVSDDGLIFKASSKTFKIDVLNVKGEKLRSISHHFDHAAMDKSKVIEWYKKWDEAFYKAVQKSSFPKHWPALRKALVDSQNRLWVATIVENLDIYKWWILDKSGKVISTFKWPRDKQIKQVKNGYLYTMEKSDLGIESVVKYKIHLKKHK